MHYCTPAPLHRGPAREQDLFGVRCEPDNWEFLFGLKLWVGKGQLGVVHRQTPAIHSIERRQSKEQSHSQASEDRGCAILSAKGIAWDSCTAGSQKFLG